MDFDHVVLTLPYGCNTYRNYDIYMQTVTVYLSNILIGLCITCLYICMYKSVITSSKCLFYGHGPVNRSTDFHLALSLSCAVLLKIGKQVLFRSADFTCEKIFSIINLSEDKISLTFSGFFIRFIMIRYRKWRLDGALCVRF